MGAVARPHVVHHPGGGQPRRLPAVRGLQGRSSAQGRPPHQASRGQGARRSPEGPQAPACRQCVRRGTRWCRPPLSPHHGHHKPCNKTKGAEHHEPRFHCPGADRAMRTVDFVTHILRLVSWIAFTVVLAGARRKVRDTYGIDGSDCNDVCYSMFCHCCVLAQLERHIKTLDDGCLSVPTPLPESGPSATIIVVPAVPIASGQQV